MKICEKEGCNNPIFGGGYCSFHQYLRNKLPKNKPKRKAIPSLSKRRSLQLTEYRAIKEEMIAEAKEKGPIRCFASGEKIYGIPEIHHLDGREEDALTDRPNLVFIKRKYHHMLHDLSIDKLMKERWYDTFLNNLKERNPRLYVKEIHKRTKLLNGWHETTE